MGLEPEDRKRLLLVGDVEGGLAKLYSQVVGQGKQGLGLAWSVPQKIPRNVINKNVFINRTAQTIFNSES